MDGLGVAIEMSDDETGLCGAAADKSSVDRAVLTEVILDIADTAAKAAEAVDSLLSLNGTAGLAVLQGLDLGMETVDKTEYRRSISIVYCDVTGGLAALDEGSTARDTADADPVSMRCA